MRRQVMIRQGCVDGFSDADPVITVFRGIPYAKPPVDELRWREPQPAEAWDGVLEAGDFAPMPMQPLPGSDEFYGREWQIDADTPMAEDCLYLNIWTPALRGCGSGSEIRTDSRCDGHSVGKGQYCLVWWRSCEHYRVRPVRRGRKRVGAKCLADERWSVPTRHHAVWRWNWSVQSPSVVS